VVLFCGAGGWYAGTPVEMYRPIFDPGKAAPAGSV